MSLRLGDEVWAYPYWPLPPTAHEGWKGRVKAFKTKPERVLVEAVDKSDDPLVGNEQWFHYGALRKL